MAADPVIAQLAAHKTAQISELKAKWRDLFEGEPPPYTGASSNIGWLTGFRNWPLRAETRDDPAAA